MVSVVERSRWGGQGAGVTARIQIPQELLVMEVITVQGQHWTSRIDAPLRLRPEIEFWLCGQGCKGWVVSKEFVYVGEGPLPSHPVYDLMLYVDFADPDDALWFKMRWVGG